MTLLKFIRAEHLFADEMYVNLGDCVGDEKLKPTNLVPLRLALRLLRLPLAEDQAPEERHPMEY